MESYQAANVIFVAIILWTAIKNSGKTIPEKTEPLPVKWTMK